MSRSELQAALQAGGGGDARVAELLRDAPHLAIAADRFGATALHWASTGPQVEALVAAVPDARAALRALDKEGRSPLDVARENGLKPKPFSPSTRLW